MRRPIFVRPLSDAERYAAERGKRHKKITDWARQSLLLVRRWWPEREIVAVADSGRARQTQKRRVPTPKTRRSGEAEVGFAHHPPDLLKVDKATKRPVTLPC